MGEELLLNQDQSDFFFLLLAIFKMQLFDYLVLAVIYNPSYRGGQQ